MRFVVDKVLALGYTFTASASVVYSQYHSANAVQTFMKFFTIDVRSW